MGVYLVPKPPDKLFSHAREKTSLEGLSFLGRRSSNRKICRPLRLAPVRSSLEEASLSFPSRSSSANQKNQQEFRPSMLSLEKIRYVPQIVPLPSKFLPLLLPYSGTGEQILQNLGGPATWLRRAVISMATSVVFYNVNVILSVTAALYWAWSPIVLSSRVNFTLRMKYKYAGLWKALVLESSIVEHVVRLEKELNEKGRMIVSPVTETRLKLVVGEDSGLCIEVLGPLPPSRLPPLQPGEPAELLVLSDKPTFSRFNAVRAVYIPGRQMWIAEESSIERSVFEEVSAGIAASSYGAQGDLDGGADFDTSYQYAEDKVELESRGYDAVDYRRNRMGAGRSGGGDYDDFLDERHDPMGAQWDYQDMRSASEWFRE